MAKIKEWHHSEETRRKISKSKTGVPSKLRGVPRSEETKQKISLSNKGKIRTQEVKQRIKLKLLGRKLTDEHRMNIIKNHSRGEQHHFYGKKRSFSEEIKKKGVSPALGVVPK